MKKLVGSALYNTLEPLSRRRDINCFLEFALQLLLLLQMSDGLHTSMFSTFLLLAPFVVLTLCTLSVFKFLEAGLFAGRPESLFPRQINGTVFLTIIFQIV